MSTSSTHFEYYFESDERDVHILPPIDKNEVIVVDFKDILKEIATYKRNDMLSENHSYDIVYYEKSNEIDEQEENDSVVTLCE